MDAGDTIVTMNPLEEIVPPAHRIPPEIIVKIIRGLLPAKIKYPRRIEDRVKSLLTATSICRYWRYAVLDNAALWSVVPAYRKTLGPLFLQRSRNVPLSIVFYADAPRRCSAHQATVSLLPHIQRVRNSQFFAPPQALNEMFFTLERFGTHLDEIGIEIKSPPTGGEWAIICSHLLNHAPTLKVLKLEVYKFPIPVQQLQLQLPQLSHLEISGLHDLCAVSYLLTSLPTLVSIKVRVESHGDHEDYHQPPDPVIPHVNLRNIHLQVGCYPLKVVLDTLKIHAGVHLKCDIVGCRHWRPTEQEPFLPLPLEFFENTSQIEELIINGSLRFKCSGSGPSGSFRIKAHYSGEDRKPLEDFSHLRRLVVVQSIDQELLEGIVVSAPQLTSLIFNRCMVSRSWAADPAIQELPCVRDPVDIAGFVMAMGKERSERAKLFKSIRVDGTMEGDSLGAYKLIVGKPV